MGVIWNVLHPLALIAVYSVVFRMLWRASLPGIEGKFAYTLWLCAGFLPWNAVAECVNRGCQAFSANAHYMKKLPIPEQVFVAQTAVSATIGLAISFALLLVASLLLGSTPTWHWALLPVPLVLLQAVGFGLGVGLGTLNVFFRDVSQLTGIVLQVAFWLTPITYPWSVAPAWIKPVLACHPATPAVEAVRSLFVYGQLPAAWTWWAMVGWAAAAVVAGSLTLHALRAEIRDVL
jgi:lipopolysaccharide transport system permease protein